MYVSWPDVFIVELLFKKKKLQKRKGYNIDVICGSLCCYIYVTSESEENYRNKWYLVSEWRKHLLPSYFIRATHRNGVLESQQPTRKWEPLDLLKWELQSTKKIAWELTVRFLETQHEKMRKRTGPTLIDMPHAKVWQYQWSLHKKPIFFFLVSKRLCWS